MDLEAHLRRLIHPLTEGDELAPGARVVRLAVDEGLQVTVALGGERVVLELARAEEGGRFAVKTPRMLLRYRAQGGEVSSQLGLSLCRALAARVTVNEAEALAELARATTDEGARDDGLRVREVQVTRALVDAGSAGERHHTITPYVGCLVGCRFCYAQARVGESRRLAGLPEVPWGSFVDVRVNLPEVLEAELASAPARPVKFCPIVSDPYQAIEKRLSLTQRCLEVLARGPPRPVMVLTRAALVERDLALLASMPRALVGVSLPTADDAVRRHFEPRGAAVEERLGLLERFARAGVETFAVVQPQLPGDVEALADALARTVRSVSLGELEETYGAEAEFAAPAFAFAREAAWQRERARAVEAALRARGVAVWSGDLPPSVLGPGTA